MITVTDSAVKHLKHLLTEKDATPAQGLRLFVQKGGCAGHQYAMAVRDPEPDDTVIEREGVKVFIEAESLPFLDGSEVDYENSLNDSGFKIINPNAARSCGCGTSFEPTTTDEPPTYDSSLDGTVCGSTED